MVICYGHHAANIYLFPPIGCYSKQHRSVVQLLCYQYINAPKSTYLCHISTLQMLLIHTLHNFAHFLATAMRLDLGVLM